MNTVGKILDSIITRRLQYYAEQYHLLPRNHTGRRKATSSEHALHLLVEEIYEAWRNDKAYAQPEEKTHPPNSSVLSASPSICASISSSLSRIASSCSWCKSSSSSRSSSSLASQLSSSSLLCHSSCSPESLILKADPRVAAGRW
ncbi:hypothetical protein KCU67_g16, partial [Aureobasidium melanogenum]